MDRNKSMGKQRNKMVAKPRSRKSFFSNKPNTPNPPQTRPQNRTEGDWVNDGCIRISEVHWNPASQFQGNDADYEFIELVNVCDYAINLYGWKISSSTRPLDINNWNTDLDDDTWVGNPLTGNQGGADGAVGSDHVYTRFKFSELWSSNEWNSVAAASGGILGVCDGAEDPFHTEWGPQGSWYIYPFDENQPQSRVVIASKANSYLDEGYPLIMCYNLFEWTLLSSGGPWKISNNDEYINIIDSNGDLVDYVRVCGGSDCPATHATQVGLAGYYEDWRSPGDGNYSAGKSAEMKLNYLLGGNDRGGYHPGMGEYTYHHNAVVNEPVWKNSLLAGGSPGNLPDVSPDDMNVYYKPMTMWPTEYISFPIDFAASNISPIISTGGMSGQSYWDSYFWEDLRSETALSYGDCSPNDALSTCPVDGIITGASAAQFNLDWGGWVGSLSEINPQKGYMMKYNTTLMPRWRVPTWKFKNNSQVTFIDPNTWYDLEGSNCFVSYPLTYELPIEDAIPHAEESELWGVATSANAALWTGSMWVGSLRQIKPFTAYWLIFIPGNFPWNTAHGWQWGNGNLSSTPPSSRSENIVTPSKTFRERIPKNWDDTMSPYRLIELVDKQYKVWLRNNNR